MFQRSPNQVTKVNSIIIDYLELTFIVNPMIVLHFYFITSFKCVAFICTVNHKPIVTWAYVNMAGKRIVLIILYS